MTRQAMIRHATIIGVLLAIVSIVWWWSPRQPHENPQVLNIDEKPVKLETRKPLEGKELLRQQLLAGLALSPESSFPASLPWAPLLQVGDGGLFPLEAILRHQPLRFLEMCKERYDREVKGYTLTFLKRERVRGKLLNPEKISVHFREKPFSVHFDWLEGAGRAQRVLYVDGANDGYMRVRPTGVLINRFLFSKKVDGAEALQTSRYSILQFGLQKGTIDTLRSMHKAEKRNALHLHYEGLVKVAQLGNRPCYKFLRKPYDPPEEDNLFEMTLYIDQETWLQVGSVLRDIEGNLIAEYFFRDIVLNPSFDAKQFTDKAL